MAVAQVVEAIDKIYMFKEAEMVYNNLEQRMAQKYIDMFPSFVPCENASVSVTEQEQFYSLMKNLYQLAFNEPLLFVPSLHEDDAYPNPYKKGYNKPDLILDMRKFNKTVDALLENMFLLGRGDDNRFNKRQQVVLSRLGIEDFANLPLAWVWMSKREDADLTTFSHCMFDKNYPYTSDIYARLLGEAAFKKIENWMLAKGYKQFNITDITASDCKLSLTIANPKWSSDSPRGGHEYKIKHTGISAQYDFYVKSPVRLGLCIPNGMKPYLTAFDSMDTGLQNFVVKCTKKCDDCGYCVQTDKTGTRPKAYISINYKDKEYQLCTYFPGYKYCWSHMDEELAEILIKMLTFMDKFAPK